MDIWPSHFGLFPLHLKSARDFLLEQQGQRLLVIVPCLCCRFSCSCCPACRVTQEIEYLSSKIYAWEKSPQILREAQSMPRKDNKYSHHFIERSFTSGRYVIGKTSEVNGRPGQQFVGNAPEGSVGDGRGD